jgi:hypothetical protein
MYAYFLYLYVSSSTISQLLDLESIIVFIVISLLIALSSYFIVSYFKSKRIEFFLNFARVKTSWRGDRTDILYSDLELGPPRIRMVRASVSLLFKIRVKGEGKRSTWEVTDGEIKGLNTNLYSWLRKRVRSEIKD